MDTKTFIRTLKLLRGKYLKTPNVESEKKAISNLVHKYGANALSDLNKSKELELITYIQEILGLKMTSAKSKEEDKEIAQSTDGKTYIVDTINKTCKRVKDSFEEQSLEDLGIEAISLKPYQVYLKDMFPSEDVVYKKGKILFRGYRISLTIKDGFMVEDTMKNYEIVTLPFDGIPTRKELGEWFKKPTVVSTPEDIAEAIKRGRELQEERKKEREEKKQEELKPVNYEKLRGEVLKVIKGIRNGKDYKLENLTSLIPFRRWKRSMTLLLNKYKNKEIRRAKYLNEIERITKEETFVVEEKRHRSSFKGTIQPDYRKVGYLKGDKIEVDDTLIDAVPFLLNCLLADEPRAMSQLMKYSRGEISEKELLLNPISIDWKEEFNSKALKNTPHNAQILTCMFDVCGLVAPQDLLYETDLKVGDKIVLLYDGELKNRTISKVEGGVELGRNVGLLKTDKWFLKQ